MRSYVLSVSLLLGLQAMVSAPAAARTTPSLEPAAGLGSASVPQQRRDRIPPGASSGQLGLASYYWQPQRLASGGQFDPNALTASHKSLPFGTRVRVRHLGNGRSVDVRINDRGPYIGGRIIDLSKAAAAVIGMTGQGVARVAVTVLGH
jgi:rare lipoprotein A